TVGRTEQHARPRGHRKARPAAVARNQRARPAAPPGTRLRHAAVAAVAGAGRRRPDRRRAGRDRRQVFRLPRAPARGDRTPPAPRGHHDPDGFALIRRARPVGGSPPEAGARASGTPRPGPAHPRHDPRRDLAAARPPRPRPRGLTARHNLLPEPHLIVGAAEAANSIAASAAPTMGASRFPGAPMRKLALALIPLALAACGGPDDPAVVGDVDPTAAYEVHAWPLPATEGSAQPDMAMTADGRLLLSWISSIPGRRNALQFVSLSTNGRWQSAPRTIAVGETLAANWANIPHITTTPDGTLWVHWLQRIGEGYAADIALSRSTDAGFNWSPPVLVNDDGTATEHGFASLWSAGNGTLGIAWLDGRGNATDADATAHQHAAKAHEHGGRGTQVDPKSAV